MKKNKCWNTKCKRWAWLEIVGWSYCFKHWRSDYKWGMCHGLWKALLWTKVKPFIKESSRPIQVTNNKITKA